MKIWCISDTHCKHKELKIPENIDMVIHAGDVSNEIDLSNNEAQVREFMYWFKDLPIKYKIYVPGNHDTSVEAGMVEIPEGVNLLVHESIDIEGIKIFGSPYTPSFGTGFAYNISRSKIDLAWKIIPGDTDILITHGPPKGILDYTAINNNAFTQCGCKSLLNRVKNLNIIYHIFGHIHNESNVLNYGVYQNNNMDTTFINVSTCNLTHTKPLNKGIVIDYIT